MGEQMNTINQVIILGAGASKSEGAPLQSELFIEFFKSYKNDKQGKLILDFFKDFWGININNFQSPDIKFPTFEECLGILDWAHIRNECLRGYSQERLNTVRSALIYLIAKVLDENLKEKDVHHKCLVNRLVAENMLTQTAFISLNYDIIIDNVLTELAFDFNIDYGLDSINANRKKQARSSVLLLKLHGSLNWLYCPTCNNMEITPKKKQAIKTFYKEEKCSICHAPTSPIIIPPTLYKEMNNPFIQQIILKTDIILRNVEKIFFCGYSFSDSDMHLKYLLKRAEIFNNITPEIHIINYHDGKKEVKLAEEKERFIRFFNNVDNIFYHQDISFENFAKNGVKQH